MDVPDPWLAVATLAARQWGRVSTAQLHAAGIGRGAIEKAVRSGRLHRLHRGVYAVGHLAPSDHGRWMAAVLACGGDAALSHRSAARLHRIGRGEGMRPDVTVPGDRRPPQITVHRAPLPPHHVTDRAGIRVTTVARTIADLAHELEDDGLRGVVREAQFLGVFDLAATKEAAGRRPSRPLNDLVEEMLGSSRLNDDFLRLLRRHRLPLPLPEHRLRGHRVDFVYEHARVAIELDGYRAHRSVDAFQRDLAIGNALQLAGWLLLRFSWADVHRRPRQTAATVRRALGT